MKMLRTAVALACFLPVAFALPPATTRILDTIYATGPGSVLASGYVTITASSAFTTADGGVVATTAFNTFLVNGVLDVSLLPNLGSTPAGTSYRADYHTGGPLFTERWIVPVSTTPVNLAAIRTGTPPTPTVLINLSQLTPGSSDGYGMAWSASSNQWVGRPMLTSPLTTLGDLIVASSGGGLSRLGIGSPGQVLTVTGGTAAWSAAPGGTWGTIAGTLSNQADLQSAFNGKQNSLGYTPLNPANNLSEVGSAATARTNIGAQAALGFTPENIANKGNASGYASLDGGGKVPAAQLPASVFATWGTIAGTLSAQTDLSTALSGKQATITTGPTAQYFRGDLSLATFPLALPPNGAAGGILGGTYPNPTCPTCVTTAGSYSDPTWLTLTWGSGRLTGIPAFYNQTIQSGGTPLTQRAAFNFSSEFAAVDNSGSARSDVSVNSIAGAKITGNISGNAGNITGVCLIANGCTGQTSASAAFAALSPTTTLGDLIYQGSSVPARLAGNTTATRNFLRQAGTGTVSAAPVWDTLQAGDVPSLAGTYAITGRAINTTSPLGGGGDLSADRTLTCATCVVTSGSYANPLWITSLPASVVGLGSVENTALSTWAGSANITTLGTLTAGTVPTARLSGVLLAAQEPAHTGDITNTAGSLVTTLKNTGTVGTYTKITFDAQGRETSGASAQFSDIGGIAVPGQLPVCVASGVGHAAGIVPDPGASAGASRFLREDCVWGIPAGGGNVGGPGSSTNGFVPQWSGVSGTVLSAGLPVSATPGASTIVLSGGGGKIDTGWLPTPTASTLGGVQSFAAVSHQWISSISTAGVPVSTQPTVADLADAKTGSGSVVLATAPTVTNLTTSQGANGNDSVTARRFTDTSPTGNFSRYRDAANTVDLWAVDVTGTLTAGTVPYARLSGAPGAITALTGDVGAAGPGSAVATVSAIGGKAVTLAGALNTSGAFGLTLTTTATTNVTLPTSGTLVNTAVTSLGSLTSAAALTTVGTIGTGVWQGTPVTPVYGGTGATTLAAHGVLIGAGTSTVNVTGTGSSGWCLTSNGASADPTFQACPSAGANVSLSNLSAVAINTSLLPGSAGTLNLGSGALPWASAYIGGAATNNAQLTGTFTAARVLTLPDETGTLSTQSGVETLGNKLLANAQFSGLATFNNAAFASLFTAGTGGVGFNLTAKNDGSGNLITATTADTEVLGVSASFASAGANSFLQFGGWGTCIAGNTVTNGHLIKPSTITNGRCDDTGQTLMSATDHLTGVIGEAVTGATAGASFQYQAFGPGHSGWKIYSGTLPVTNNYAAWDATGQTLKDSGIAVGSGGNPSANQLTDYTLTTTTGPNTTAIMTVPTGGTNVQLTNTVINTPVATYSAVLGAGACPTSGTVWFSTNPSGVPQIDANSGVVFANVTVTGMVKGSNTASGFPSANKEGWTQTCGTVANKWDTTAPVDNRAFLYKFVPTAGASGGLTITASGASTAFDLQRAKVPFQFQAGGAPGVVTGSQIGDVYTDTTAHATYTCTVGNAPCTTWVATGGGGSSITSGHFSALPGTCTTGNQYLFDDAIYTSAFCISTNTWAYYYRGTRVYPPTLQTWTAWGNQGTGAAIDTGNGNIILRSSALGTQSVDYRYKAVPATPYSTTIMFELLSAASPGAGFPECGFVFSDGTGVILEGWGYSATSGVYTIGLDKLTNATTFASSYTASPTYKLGPTTLWMMTIADDGTNRTVSYALPGQSAVQVHSVAHADFLTPTRVGFGCNTNSSSTVAAMNLISWN